MVQPRRFEIAPCPQPQLRALERELGVSGALAQVLVRRGLGDPRSAQAFLAADEEHPPSAFAGIGEALARILAHVRARTLITVHGDYDVDGICSTAVLVRALRALGADVDWYLPDRASDGYGLNARTVERLAARGTRLLLTADCGITSVEEVRLAQALGMEVVVSDHHSPRADGVLPKAPIVHPSVCGYPCPDLCATAVAYKLALGLCDGSHHDPCEDLDLVALATIADVVPLLGENRALVRRGLRALAATTKPGLRALLALARSAAGQVSERTVGFALAPRLNAAGRMYRADAGLELILTEDPVRAQEIAAELDRANHERRHTETRIMFDAERQVAVLGERAAYVLAGEDWHQGVIGIVASRLAERHHRPFVLIALEGGADRNGDATASPGFGRGSGRSIAGFDLLGALDACAGHLVRHGGHRAAAGLEIERERLEDFGSALAAHAERVMSADALVASERVDAIVQGDELGMELAEELQVLAPFGSANPSVALLVRDARFAERRAMGEGRHVRFTVLADGARAPAVAFGSGASLPVRDGVPADATFALEVNEWRGVSEPRLVLRHAQAAGESDALSTGGAELAASQPPDAQQGELSASQPPDAQQGELALFAIP